MKSEQVPGGTPVAEMSYTEASSELDAIVEFFEQREVDVDQLVARLARATAIAEELDRRVRLTRAQVEELVPKLQSVASESEAGDYEHLEGGAYDVGDDLAGEDGFSEDD